MKEFTEFLDKMNGLIKEAESKGHIIVRIEDLEKVFPELKGSLEYLYDGWRKSDKQFKGQFRCAIACLAYQAKQEQDARYENLEELLAADNIYQMAMNDAMVEEAKAKAVNALSELCIGRLLGVEKQGENTTDKVEPKFHEGDVMRTLQEADAGVKEGMPVIISIDKEYYHCTNELIAIKDQDSYEYPPMNRRQKTIDKVEPKFHDGDWIVQENIGVYKIIEVCESWYEVVDNKDKHYSIGFDKEYMCHLWTIQDVKDGDILYGGDNVCLFRKKMEDDDAIWVDAYCGIGSNGTFYVNDEDECWCLACNCVPATKEQRDQLEKAMADAGYTFDFDKKELRRIEQKPAWSEEDKKMIHYIIEYLERLDRPTGNSCIKWLKSLRPQKQWKPSDEQIEFTHHEEDESLEDAVMHQMEDDGDIDDFVRKGFDYIALKYAKLGAKGQKMQKIAAKHNLAIWEVKGWLENIKAQIDDWLEIIDDRLKSEDNLKG